MSVDCCMRTSRRRNESSEACNGRASRRMQRGGLHGPAGIGPKKDKLSRCDYVVGAGA